MYETQKIHIPMVLLDVHRRGFHQTLLLLLLLLLLRLILLQLLLLLLLLELHVYLEVRVLLLLEKQLQVISYFWKVPALVRERERV